MKLLTIIILTLLIGCGGLEDTTLTIENNTFIKLYSVKWNGAYFGDVVGMTTTTMIVPAGISPIYFRFALGGDNYITSSDIDISPGEAITFTFENSTLVRKVD